jgi:hypothetical protein
MTEILPILVPPEAQAALAQEATAAAGPLATMRIITIQTPEQAKLVADVESEAHRRFQDLEARRKTITTPLDQAKKAVDALFKPVTEPYKQIKAACAQKRSEYETRLREAEVAARETAKALSAQGDTGAAAAIVEAAKVPPSPGTTWKWRVKRVQINLVPLKFLTLDEDAVDDYCADYKDSEVIPPVEGLEFERVAQTRVRT